MKAELALVRERIAWTRRQLCRVDQRILSLNEQLWMTLNEEHYATAKRIISASSTKTFNKARSTHAVTQIAKFTKLTSFGRTHRRQEDLASHPLQRTVINMSARRLTPVEEDVLALGLNFAVVPRVLPKEEFVQRLEPKLYHMTNDEASNIRVQITEVLRRATLPASNLTKNKKDTLKNLRADKSIHILKADKGNATVILDRLEYDSKILALLNTSTYKELKRDPTANIERKYVPNYLVLKRQLFNEDRESQLSQGRRENGSEDAEDIQSVQNQMLELAIEDELLDCNEAEPSR
ncbi:Hypothetical predicted protein, partial [Paramuricea clavata]